MSLLDRAGGYSEANDHEGQLVLAFNFKLNENSGVRASPRQYNDAHKRKCCLDRHHLYFAISSEVKRLFETGCSLS